jgi:sugar phosphate isomerase/epimerase
MLLLPPAARASEQGLPNPFFAMDTALRHADYRDPAVRADLLKELGYDGIAPSTLNGLAASFAPLDRNGLKTFAVYLPVSIDDPAYRVDPAWTEAMKLLEGRGTVLWVPLTSKRYKPSATDGDAQAVQVVRAIAEAAREHGLTVSIYPHAGFYVQTVDDALRVVKKAGRDNVGATFNLCHALMVQPDADLEATLSRAAPHLNMVSINGADTGGTNWKQLIQPLGRGTYDVRQVLAVLKGIGYAGPIGFQGYGIREDPRRVLEETIAAWRRYGSGP